MFQRSNAKVDAADPKYICPGIRQVQMSAFDLLYVSVAIRDFSGVLTWSTAWIATRRSSGLSSR